MSWRAILVAVLGTGAIASPAQATTLVTPDGQVAQPFQRWANRSPVPTPRGKVVVTMSADACGGYPACANPGRIYISMKDAPNVFLHELGHVFDMQNTGTDWRGDPGTRLRNGYRNIMGDHRPWWEGGDISVAEQFADRYASCADGPRVEWVSLSRTTRRVCGLLLRLPRK